MLLPSWGLFIPCFLFHSRGREGWVQREATHSFLGEGKVCIGGNFSNPQLAFLISEGEVCTDRCWAGSFSAGGSLSLSAGA